MDRRVHKHHAASVFLLNLYNFDDTAYRQCLEKVSVQRRERAERYCRQGDRVRCVMSELLVRYVYHSIQKNKKLPEFVYPPYGKPYLAGDPAFRFSVSHTGMYVAVGYAEEELGIDVEQIDRSLDRKAIAASVFTKREQAYIFGAVGEQTCMLRFAQLWTVKESYLKYLGCGFRKSPLSFSVDPNNKTISENETGAVLDITFINKPLSKHYYLTVCGKIKELFIEDVAYTAIMDVI